MFDLVTAAGEEMVKNIFQIILGSVLAVPAYNFGIKKNQRMKPGLLGDITAITAAALAGVVLPIGLYGLIPLMGVLLFVRIKFYAILPLFISNGVFNMLIPFNDPSFIWSTGYRRVVLALIMAILAGILARMPKDADKSFLDVENLYWLCEKPQNIRGVIRIISRCINVTGIYLIAGVILHTVFHKYVLWSVLSFLSTNPRTAVIPRFFAGYDVVNPVFLLAMSLILLMMDFINLSAVFAIFKFKGTVIYVGYHALWIVLLGASAFI